jgi:hypothetical protein
MLDKRSFKLSGQAPRYGNAKNAPKHYANLTGSHFKMF